MQKPMLLILKLLFQFIKINLALHHNFKPIINSLSTEIGFMGFYGLLNNRLK